MIYTYVIDLKGFSQEIQFSQTFLGKPLKNK